MSSEPPDLSEPDEEPDEEPDDEPDDEPDADSDEEPDEELDEEPAEDSAEEPAEERDGSPPYGEIRPISPATRPARAIAAPAEGSIGEGDGPTFASPDGPWIGPGDAGGRNGMSMVSVVPPASSFDPAVIAASVGTDASPTRSATMSTYRRVGPEKPESAR
ncbi:hypothetical protein ACQP2F_00620 [Actinoplanes sp. CA-030573]|uniref:hypothetical protein n=1 Tax=Actinoplanes sp. CA-030573 TaxID=3239898 RepID=UPI003D89B4EA